VPVIDGGVGEGLRGRVLVLVPGSACLECGWGRDDYRLLSREYPCIPGASAEAPPTAAPAFLGTAVASVMAAEATRFLSGEKPEQSQEIAFDLLHRTQHVSRLRHNPRCRTGHILVAERLTLGPFEEATAGGLLDQVRSRVGPKPLNLECRRGLGPAEGFSPGRLLDPQWLREAGPARLRDLGFDCRDLVRVTTTAGSFFVEFSHGPP
jgi:hypothetical protein